MSKGLNKLELRLENQERSQGAFFEGFSVYIDGRNFLDTVREIESKFPDATSPGGYVPNYPEWFLGHFKDNKAEDVPLFVSSDMIEGDWDLGMSYETEDGVVKWFNFHQDHKADWDYSELPTFQFDEIAYRKEFKKVADFVELDELKMIVRNIVWQAKSLKDKFTDQKDAPVNYACIFAHNDNKYIQYEKVVKQWGERRLETATGVVYEIPPMETVAGKLKLLKLRRPDPDHWEIGDADFTVTHYSKFKAEYLNQSNFQLVERPGMEMIELRDSTVNARAYFSYPTLAEVLAMGR